VPFLEDNMSLRNEINSAMKEAMKEKAQLRLSTLRLINAAIKDRDIAARAEGVEEGVDDSEILAILGKMTRQRQESAKTYEEAGRLDLSERELSEIQVIEHFLPRQLNGDEIEIEVTKVIDEQGASSIRDMGRVMSCLKERFTGQMDFGSVGPIVKKKLSN
tara:strand:+ start:32 stop:514 length:483 start_codon:yes stop_codon:yes gene_type:complete